MSTDRQARGTVTDAWIATIPFDPLAPYANGTAGVLLPDAAAEPAASLHIHKVSAGNYRHGSNHTPGDLDPMVNPTNLDGAHAWWLQNADNADILCIRPYLALYSSAAHTAFASAPAADAGSCRMDFWVICPKGGRIQELQEGLPVEFLGTYMGGITVKNNGVAMTSGTKRFPASAQFCHKATIEDDMSISPGLVIVGGINESAAVPQTKTTGALHVQFDKMGGKSVIVEVSAITSTSWGIGFDHKYL